MTPQAKREITKKLNAGLRQVARGLTREAKLLATRHTDTGQRRSAITHIDEGDHVLWGIPKAAAPHAVHLEFGFRPHWVPMRHLHGWARRNHVGQIKKTSINGRTVKTYSRARATTLGVFVGGQGSSLDYAKGGAVAKQFRGRGRRVTVRYATKGKPNKYLSKGKVGSPILRPVVAETLPKIGRTAFLKGYANA